MKANIPTEKLQKILARAGYGSRRLIEEWIKAGRVQINDRQATIGDRASLSDRITIDGKICRIDNQFFKTRMLLYHKPAGEVCSRSDPEQRPSVFDRLPTIRNARWISIGRLDFNTSGLLMFTNDGQLAHRLMHPSAQIEREYAVRILGNVNPALIERLTQGIQLEDGFGKFDMIRDAGGEGSNHWYHVIVKQGRNRFVRRMWESQNLQVTRLIRVRFGLITLPRFLRPGSWMELENKELQKLQKLS